MKKILLMGNPNVGKSAVFSRLTGVQVIASNYPGTTVEFTQGNMKIGDEKVVVIDVPGVYDLNATSKAEKIALEMLKDGDIVINVIDATNLERNLHLTLHLLEKNIPLIIALNIWDETKHKGITIDVEKLENILGVPVIPTVGITGEGIKELVLRIPEAVNKKVRKKSEKEKWMELGNIIEKVQTLEHRHHTFLEILGDASVKPSTGIPIAIFMIITTYIIIRFIGEGLIGYMLDPVFEKLLKPLLMQLSFLLQPFDFIHTILIGKLIDNQIDFVQSFGLLTTGIYVPIAMVLPYIFSFYLILGFLEDLGYLPRLAVLMDSIMHRVGLHGWAIIPVLLGFGCNVPGILATRILEDRREKLIASTLISIGVPCAALQAMIIGLLGERGFKYVGIVYLTLFLVWIILGWILNKILRGRSLDLILEVPPYRLPNLSVLFKKLWMRVLSFLKEALPLVLFGILIIDILYYIKVFDFLANLTAPLFIYIFGLPKESVVALVIGFLRKDVAFGMLGTLNLTSKQLTVAATVLSMFFPCIATFIVLIKELGIIDMFKSVAIMIVSSIIVGGILNLII